jgi:hypothetical protein
MRPSKPLVQGAPIRCPACATTFTVAASPAVAPSPWAPQQPPTVPSTSPHKVDSGRVGVLLFLFVSLLLLAASALGMVWFFSTQFTPTPDKDRTENRRADDGPARDRPKPPPNDADAGPRRDDGPVVRPVVPVRPPDPPKPPATLPEEEQQRVDRAVAAGVAFLKRQQVGGSWKGGEYELGYNALFCLTLLECGLALDDPAARGAIEVVRKLAPDAAPVYQVSLAVLLLDKVGTAQDKELIRRLALRLIEAQSSDGSWGYDCLPALSDKEEAALLTALEKTRPRSLADLDLGLARPGRDDGERAPEEAFARALESLPEKLRTVAAVQTPARLARIPPREMTDNSNTQFALLALWAAGRHGVPTERALALTARHFRATQHERGGWGYQKKPNDAPYSAMTAAGLIALGVGHGLAIRLNPDEANRARVDDPAIRRGMTALTEYLGVPLGPKLPRARNREPINLYYLWSLERLGVLYATKTIGGKNWYQWGAELLVDHQNDDGSWTCGVYAGSNERVDTAFALLFLKRADLVKDLSGKIDFAIESSK